MDNPNNGIVAYFGSSRAGWSTYSKTSLSPSLKYEESFYKLLFDDTKEEKSFAALTTNAKYKLLGSCDTYNTMRWLQIALNSIGDPEMQIYTRKAPKILFTNSGFANGDSIRIETPVEGCRICVFTTSDLGKNFYKVFNDTTVACFKSINEPYAVYMSKTGYSTSSRSYNNIQVVLPPWGFLSVNNDRQSKNMHVKYRAAQDGSKGLLTISDIMGNLKASFPLDSSCDYIEVDTSKVGSGIHIINLVVDGAACDYKKESF